MILLENLVDDGLHHISIEIKVKGLYYEIHGVYRSPCFELNRFHDKMETWLQKFSVNRPCLIVVDMNVPINLVNNNVLVKYRKNYIRILFGENQSMNQWRNAMPRKYNGTTVANLAF